MQTLKYRDPILLSQYKLVAVKLENIYRRYCRYFYKPYSLIEKTRRYYLYYYYYSNYYYYRYRRSIHNKISRVMNFYYCFYSRRYCSDLILVIINFQYYFYFCSQKPFRSRRIVDYTGVI